MDGDADAGAEDRGDEDRVPAAAPRLLQLHVHVIPPLKIDVPNIDEPRVSLLADFIEAANEDLAADAAGLSLASSQEADRV